MTGLRRYWPALTLGSISIFGVATVRASYMIAEKSRDESYFALFWLGFLAVLISIWVFGRHFGDRWRLVSLAWYGLFTLLPKIYLSPSSPDYFDEFGWLRHTNDILHSGSLDVANTYEPISKYYPMLSVVTDAVHEVTRLSVWHSGQVVVAAAHIGSLLVVWRIAVLVGVSSDGAFLAALIFGLNPDFMYFDTQFAYESLGLPLALCAIMFLLSARRATSRNRALAWSAAATVTGVAVVFTHHISAAFASVLLIIVAVVVPAGDDVTRTTQSQLGPFAAAGLTALTFVIWVSTGARSTVSYLGGHIGADATSFVDLLLRRKANVPSVAGTAQVSVSRGLFGSSNLPFYEIVCAFLAPALAFVIVASAFLQAWWHRGENSALRRCFPFLLLGIAYFVSLIVDLTAAGGETAHRMWSYTYVGVAICAVSGMAVWERLLAWLPALRRVSASAVAAVLSILAVGNVAVGQNVYYRFPGPYTFGTDTRSRTPGLYAVAAWASTHIPAGSHVVTDRVSSEVIEADTRLNVPTPAQSDNVYYLYIEGNQATLGVRRYLRANNFSYWVLDLRLAQDDRLSTVFAPLLNNKKVSPTVLLTAGDTDFLQVIYKEDDYEVLKINP